MSETPVKNPKRTWLVIVLTVLVLVLLGVVLFLVLSGRQSATPPSESPTATTSQSATPTSAPSPDPTPTPEAHAPSAELVQHFSDAISSGNTAALEQNMAPSVFVIQYGTECCGDLEPVQAIASLDYLSNATGTWEFPAPAALVAGYREGAYAEYFPVNSIVGASTDGFVVSFVLGPEDRVTTIFLSPQLDF
jgi:hypothetical protein